MAQAKFDLAALAAETRAAIDALIAQAVAAEREACAQIAQQHKATFFDPSAGTGNGSWRFIADLIRDRGTAEPRVVHFHAWTGCGAALAPGELWTGDETRVTCAACRLVPQPLGISAHVLTRVVETNARLLATDLPGPDRGDARPALNRAGEPTNPSPDCGAGWAELRDDGQVWWCQGCGHWHTPATAVPEPLGTGLPKIRPGSRKHWVGDLATASGRCWCGTNHREDPPAGKLDCTCGQQHLPPLCQGTPKMVPGVGEVWTPDA